MRRFSLFILLTALTFSACGPAATPAPTRSLPPPAVWTENPTPTLYPTPTRGVLPTATITLTPTPDPYQAYTIDALRKRSYGDGELVSTSTQSEAAFTRHFIRYPSDKLNIAGFMDVPYGKGPFPVILFLHGYQDAASYSSLDYTTSIVDDFAASGYFAIHPNMRNYPPSDSGDDKFQVGMAIDVLNLIALIKKQGGQPGPLAKADPTRIGIWAHSMGGGVALRVLTISKDIKATMLYSATSGDELKNADLFYRLSGNSSYLLAKSLPATELVGISPMYYYANITSAIKLYHGTADTVVPVAWAYDTCNRLKAYVHNVDCVFYDGAEHTFRSRYSDFGPSVAAFFKAYLNP